MSVVLLFSGGIDSTFVLSQLVRQQVAVYPLSFQDQSVFYNTKEKIAVTSILAHYRLSGHEAPMVPTDQLFVPGGFEFVPGYKLLMYFTAMAYAQHWGAEEVLTGYSSDNADFRDEHLDIIERAVHLYNETYGTSLRISHPIYNVPKATIIQQAQRNGVPLESTLSCSSDVVLGLMHCGDCGCCLRRQQAFLEANVPDPTRYAR